MTAAQAEVLELSYRNRLSHLTSTFSAVPIIEEIYRTKGEGDAFVLSQGHAALALYVVLGAGRPGVAQSLYERFGYHPHRSVEDGIVCSSGSLGMGITVALGMAMTGRTVHVLISDGECAEGAVWEALRLAAEFAPSLRVWVNFNWQSALGPVGIGLLDRLAAFCPSAQVRFSSVPKLPFGRGVEAHYHVITDAEWEAYAAM